MSEVAAGSSNGFRHDDARIRLHFLILCLIPSVLFGITRLPETFTGDQAMFVVYAERLSNGALLYTDIWDVKQPGIFLFYLVGGTLFGFSESGIHLFELLFWLLFAVLCVYLLRDHFSNTWMVYFVPTFTVGYYYLAAGSLQMTQVETLADFPIALSFLLVPKLVDGRGTTRWILVCLVSGVSIAAAIILKIAFLPLVAALSATAVTLTYLWHPEFGRVKAIIGLVSIWSICGVSLFLFTLWFDSLGILDQLLYTSFVYPREAIALHGGFDRIAVLGSSLVWFALTFLPFLILITLAPALGLTKAIRSNGAVRPLRGFILYKPKVLTGCLTVWLVVGFCVILIQTTSWWSYHFMLLLTPIGILALLAIDQLLGSVESLQRRSSKGKFAIVLIFQVAILALFNVFTVREIKRIHRDRDYGYENAIAGPYGDNWDQYKRVLGESRIVGDTNIRGRKMFACSDPLYYYLNRQTPAISTNGWMPEFFARRQWSIFEDEVSASKPDLLIVDFDCEWLITKNSVRLRQQIDDEYEVILRSEQATWRRRTEHLALDEPKPKIDGNRP